ncbi:molybdopterin-dependent oxidoreductase [Gymnodinialimonas sp. 57CJ19]|uniref:molybdopterin-dependent oxidoreductase n=1 Tax=Gymnodinialimonas sp. 57CJ19 TaxID=3138498 RepID=UPI0031344EEB
MMSCLHRFMLSALALTAMSLPSAAQDPSALQVSDGEGTIVSFALSDLDGLPQVEITTTTQWTAGENTFTGPSLRDVLDVAGLGDDDLTLTALNDYAIEMPAPEAGATYPIVASRMNGVPMSVRDKGPFWIIFPYDSEPDFQTETIYAQSIWQLDAIELAE